MIRMLAPRAGQRINVFPFAFRSGVTADLFNAMLWAYPTGPRDTSHMV